jgi:hypothetical protein
VRDESLDHFRELGRLKARFRRALVKPVKQRARLLGTQAE